MCVFDEACSELQGDLMVWHFEEDDEGLSNFLSSICKLPNPMGVVSKAEDFKNEGNKLYRSGDYAGASEKYVQGSQYIAFAMTNDEVVKSKIGDLIVSLSLNLAACLIKLGDYFRAGQLCCIVLNYDPVNIKALYRRAVAAIELGQNALACEDLIKASQLDPTDKDVSRMLVKAMSGSHGGVSEIECPSSSNSMTTRVGTNLFTSERTIGKSMDDEISYIQKAPFEDGKVRKLQEPDQRLRVASIGLDVACSEEVLSNSSIEVTVASNKSFISSVQNNLAEPKYRFSNRSRRGSSLILPSSAYSMLSKGKSLRFYNSRIGSFMTVRVLRSCDKVEPKSCQPLDLSMDSSVVTSESSVSVQMGTKDSTDDMEVNSTIQLEPRERVKSCFLDEAPPLFAPGYTKNDSETQERRRRVTLGPFKRRKPWRVTRVSKKFGNYSLATNIGCSYRSSNKRIKGKQRCPSHWNCSQQIERKRKLGSDEDLDAPPIKKATLFYNVCNNYSELNSVCSSSVFSSSLSENSTLLYAR